VYDLTARRIVIGGEPTLYSSDLETIEVWLKDYVKRIETTNARRSTPPEHESPLTRDTF